MRTTTEETRDDRALVALAELARDGVEQRTTEDLDQGLDALFTRIASGRARRRVLVRWSLVGATAACCVMVGLQVARVARTPSPVPESPGLAYQIEGGSILEGGYLRESGNDGVKLSFNEGSRLVLMPGTRGRLRAVDKEGARVAIEQGTASFQVTQRPDQRWLVEAGPFLVTVKGTVFSVSWDPSSERFELNLRHGRVVVSGPVSGGDIVLRAGQRLVVNLPRAETLITEEKLAEIPNEAVGASPSPAVVPPILRPSGTRAKSSSTVAGVGKSERDRRWADELVNGHWDRILKDVERVGLQATLEKASSEDLYALAHAARYRRRTDVARAALLAERRRFPSSPRALDALFLLGRVEESYERGMTQAIAWYDEYLSSAPKGTYAAEALGRKMTLTNELGGPGAARPIAEEYLRRFPKGSYAGSARALSRVP